MNFTILLTSACLKNTVYLVITTFVTLQSRHLSAQTHQPLLNKVLTLTGQKQGSRDIPQDHGLTGIWQKLLKLQTTASAMHTQAHPDDEHADLLTFLSRGKGVRTSLLSLNRGESGGNILGAESFDQLGLLRTEEFLLAASYYGLDDLYFTSLVDYGFSKRVEEAYEKWGRQAVLSEMVRVIRINRPLVIISRFHGTPRDGHGNHQAAGEISLEAYKLSADPAAFPEQITKEGLRPWKALKYYRGGVKVNEHWNIALNTGEHCAWIGESYKNFSLLGYSFHRSQHGGHRGKVNGSFIQYYERLDSRVKVDEKEINFFVGIDTSIKGVFKLTGEKAPPGAQILLDDVQKSVDDAVAAFHAGKPTLIIPYLTKGLAGTRAVIKLLSNQVDALFLLLIKEKQFADAINTVLGIRPYAIAMPVGKKESTSIFQPQPTMGFIVPGQSFNVHVSLLNPGDLPIEPAVVKLMGEPNWIIASFKLKESVLQTNEKVDHSFTVTAPENPVFSQPYYYRSSIQQSQYLYNKNGNVNLPNNPPVLQASVSYRVGKELVEIVIPVQVKQANLPYGYNTYTLKAAPAIAVNVTPRMGVIPKNDDRKEIEIKVELVNNQEKASTGELQIKVPEGWTLERPMMAFTFTKAGEKINLSTKIHPTRLEEKNYEVQAIATVDRKSYSQGYDLSIHRDLDQTVMYNKAVALLKGIDVKIAPHLQIGYVMGVGDEVPGAIQQLGTSVQLLTAVDLSTGILEKFDAILIGTRAYAVREDLKTYNQRLLEYAKNGGHLVVLFQTPEFNPALMAPYPAQLPPNPEEVSEENSPVKILEPNHRVFNHPNKITASEFENWVEQRGSKFFSEWDNKYTPLISTQDVGQAPQSGGWLMAAYGKGHYTYFAYSFHRQLPYGVTGAYRIMANLLSYGKK
jgi:LmbE family N-acetylglucosaminyl deacetylase